LLALIHLVIVVKVKIVIQNVNGSVHPPFVIKFVNQFVNNQDVPHVAKNWGAVNVPLNATSQNVKYVVQSSTAKRVLAQNVIQFVKSQHVTQNAQIQHQLASPFVRNHYVIGNVIVQLIVKNLNALLSVKNHHTASPKHHRPTVANLKNQQPNVVNVKILQVQVEMLVTLLHSDAKLWNFNAQVTVLPKLMQKRHHAKLHAHNLHHFANNVARFVLDFKSYRYCSKPIKNIIHI
jgi:hypothetical protein